MARSRSIACRPICLPARLGTIATIATVIGTQISFMPGGYR